MFDKRLALEGKPVWGYLTLTVGFGIVIAFLAIAQAWFFSQVVARVFLEGAALNSVWDYLICILLIIVGRAVTHSYREISAHEAAFRLNLSLRKRLRALLSV
jgi:ATP-binding cassette subfamily C protein CydD